MAPGLPSLPRPGRPRGRLPLRALGVKPLAAENVRPGGVLGMRLLRRLALPATESQMSLALVICMFVAAGLLWAVLWEANVIAQQRDLIRQLWNWRYGS